MKRFLLLLLGITALLVFACKKKSDPVNFHFEYFPLAKGTFVEYRVTQIEHDSATFGHDTTIYLLKTLVGDTVIDNEGRIVRQFFRYLFDPALQQYKIKDLWTSTIDQERGELIEENQRLIKLVFAPSIYKEWNKNAFNNSGEVLLYYNRIHKPYNIDNLYFDSTVVVEEDSTHNVFFYRRIYEVYAAGVGMIKKNFQDFTITNSNENNPIKGSELIYEVIDYGVQ